MLYYVLCEVKTMKKTKKDLLCKGVCTRITKEDKLSMKRLKKDTGLSYAQLIRDALKCTYPKYF